jgi:hypothetical protein
MVQITVIKQCRQGIINDKIDVAPISSIAPIGAAAGNKFLPAERNTSPAAIAGLNFNSNLINKLHLTSYYLSKTKEPGDRKAIPGSF